MPIIGILKESEGENRVAALPEITAQLVKMGFEVMVENGAGERAFASDDGGGSRLANHGCAASMEAARPKWALGFRLAAAHWEPCR